MKSYIIIRGSAGVGKTTISKELTKILKGYLINFDNILKENKLDAIKEDGISAQNFIKANELVIPKIKEKVENGKIVILDGCFYRKEQISNLKKNLKYNPIIFSLKAPLEDCINRNKKRNNPMTEKAIREVYELVKELDIGIHIITTGKSVEEITREIIDYIPIDKSTTL